MIPELAHAILLTRAEEAWEPVLLGGLIPILGALGVFFLLWYAARSPNDEDEGGEEERK
jgi:hypothetical protein